MGWNSDKSPIEYLEQRVKYYKKRQRDLKKYLSDEYMLERFGEERILAGQEHVENRIKEFELAVIILSLHDNR